MYVAFNSVSYENYVLLDNKILDLLRQFSNYYVNCLKILKTSSILLKLLSVLFSGSYNIYTNNCNLFSNSLI